MRETLTARLARAALSTAIVLSQKVKLFAARGSYRLPRHGRESPLPQPQTSFVKSETEYGDHASLQEHFRGVIDVASELRNKRVLDLGCGYGGRTAWYAEHALEVHGVEVFSNMVQESAGFAAHKGLGNCHFSLGDEEALHFPDSFFDVVVSYDVMEHVQDPATVLKEVGRVLKPGGIALLIFTPYFGAFAHHLNYITMLPALHWFFRPSVLVATINDLLKNHPAFAHLDVGSQPLPKLSHNQRRMVLPTLNGMTKREFQKIIAATPMDVVHMRTIGILEHFQALGSFGAQMNRAICTVPLLDEAFGHNLVSVLRKRTPSS
jgi:ubiquinone/menaquinone biosynthesis C-methylase UbiE